MKLTLNSTKLYCFAAAILALMYFYTIISYSINVPYSDDFHQQLFTGINLEKGSSVFDSLFRQHNEHRLFTTHIFTYLDHVFNGEVNLVRQVVVAVLFLITLVFVLAALGLKETRAMVLLLVAMVLLTPENGATWVGGTTQYYGVLLFSIVSILCLPKIDKPHFLIISVACMFLAVFSMIGGILLPLVVLLYFVLNKKIKTVSARLWMTCSILTVVWFFSGYVKSENKPSVFHFIQEPVFTVEFTFRLLGNFLSDVVPNNFLLFLTFAACAIFVYLLVYKRSLGALFSRPDGASFLFVLLLLGAVVAGRVGFEDITMAYADRYVVYTKVLWLLAVIILFNRKIITQSLMVTVLSVSALYMLSTYRGEVPKLADYRLAQSNAMLDYRVRDNPDGFEFGKNKQTAGRLVTQAIELGVYKPTVLVTPSRQLKYLKYTDFNDGLKATVVRNHQFQHYLYFAFVVDNQAAVHEVVIVPRKVAGPATLLNAARLIAPHRLESRDRIGGKDLYDVVIDTTQYDGSLKYDIFLISLGKITTIGSL